MERRKVLAYPTETVYGFGGAIDRESVGALIALKRRPAASRSCSSSRTATLVDRLDLHMPSYAAKLVARHWPGPLTLVLSGGEHRVPPRCAAPREAWPCGGRAIPATARLIQAHGDAITSTSANRPGVPPAMTAGEILEQWSDAVARGELRVLDGGRLAPSAPSTVVDCTGRHPRVIRPGAIAARRAARERARL